MDPRRASEVISGIPTEQIVGSAQVLEQRGEMVAMGRFVGHLKRPTLAACIDALTPETVLRIAFVLEERKRLDEIVAMLTDQRLAELAEAASKRGLEEEGADLLAGLGSKQSARLAPLLAR